MGRTTKYDWEKAVKSAKERDERSDISKLRNYYLNGLKRGNHFSVAQLKKQVAKKGWRVNAREISSLARHWTVIAKFSQSKLRPKYFPTQMVFRPGLIQIDLGFIFQKERNWVRANKGYTSILLGLDTTTNKICVVPMKTRKSKAFLKALKEIIAYFPHVHRFLSDKERGIHTKKVTDVLKNKYGIPITFIDRRNKAYLAERAIAIVRQKLMKTLYARGFKPEPWTDLVQKIVSKMNSSPVKGTSFSPNQIHGKNLVKFLDEKLGRDSTYFTNLSSLDSRSVGDRRAREKLWKFKVGDAVLIASRLSKSYQRRVGRGYYKTTKHGSFLPEKHAIHRCKLRAALKPNVLVPGMCTILTKSLRSVRSICQCKH